MNNVASIDVDILKAVIDTSCDAFEQAVLVYDRNDTLLFASKQILRFFPVAPDDLMPGTAMRHLLGAIFDSTSRYHEVQMRMTREDWIAHRLATHWNEKFDSTSRYGADRWLQAKGGRSANGIGITVLQDVSELKRRERKWQADMERMASTEALLDEMPVPLYIKDQDLTFIGVNKAFCDLYEVEPEDVLGHTVWDLTDGALAAFLEASDRKVLETGEPNRVFKEKKTPAGELRKFIRHEFRMSSQDSYLLVTILDDVTNILETAPPEEEGEGLALDQPSPPNESALDADAVDFADHDGPAEDGTRILLVSDDALFSGLCLDMLAHYGFDACTVCSLEEEKAFLAEAGRLSFLPHIVLVDDKLDEDCVRVAVENKIVAMPLNTGRPVHFLVADILANLPRLTNVGAGSETDQTGEPVFAPAGLPLFDGPDDTPIYRYSDVEVLVVEDNAVNQQVFSSILDGLDIQHRIASSGEEALGMFEELRPKLVFMDITLPGISACETAKRMAMLDSDQPGKTPIVGVLPRENANSEAECLAAGMTSCIVKPVSTEALELVYYRYVEGRPKNGAAVKS